MSDDLIKRSDAIKDLFDITNNSDMPEDWHRGMSAAISALYRVPSADRPQGWIPCSERLPSENGKTYLTCLGDSGYEWYQTLTYYDGWNCTKQDRESEIKGVVAWMPIEPWEGADDD